MKPKAKIVLSAVLLLGIAGGTAAALKPPAQPSQDAGDSGQQDQVDALLPENCSFGDQNAVLSCDGVDLQAVSRSSTAADVQSLILKNATFSDASLAGFTKLKEATVISPADEEQVGQVLGTAPALNTLRVDAPLPSGLSGHVQNASLGLLTGDPQELQVAQQANPAFSATNIESSTFFELSEKSAAKVESLKVLGTVSSDHIDLSSYGALRILDITITSDSKLQMPPHLRDSGDFDMNYGKGTVQFVAPSKK